jgi:serine/threonine protein kinase
VKTVKEGASSHEKEDLLRELEIMQQLGSHANVVTLLGCCTEKGKILVHLLLCLGLEYPKCWYLKLIHPLIPHFCISVCMILLADWSPFTPELKLTDFIYRCLSVAFWVVTVWSYKWLPTEAIHSSKMLVNTYKATWLHNPEDHSWYLSCCENLKSQIGCCTGIPQFMLLLWS